MARKYGGRKGRKKYRNHGGSKKPWGYKPSKRKPANKRKKKESTLEDFLTNDAVLEFLLKTLIVILLAITVIGSSVIIGWIWVRSEWSTGARSFLTVLVLVVTGAILYGGYRLFLG